MLSPRYQPLVAISPLIFVVVIALVCSFISYQKQMSVYAVREQLISTMTMKSNLQVLQAAANEAEASERGYLVTGEPHFINSFESAVTRADGVLKSIMELAKANRSESQDMANLNQSVRVWLSDLQTISALRKNNGFEAAKAAIEQAEHLSKIDSAETALAAAIEKKNKRGAAKVEELKSANTSRDKLLIFFASSNILALLTALYVISVFVRRQTAITSHSQVQLQVTQALIDSTNLEQAAEHVLRAIGTTYGFSFGAVWLVDDQHAIITPFKIWQSDKMGETAFIQMTRKTEFKKGIGMPGRVWQSGTPHWITDVVVADNYPRAQAALETGFHAAFGFPIFKENNVIGMVEFYFNRIKPMQKDLVNLLSPFGHEIGHFMERMESRDALLEDAFVATFAADVGRIVTTENDLTTMLQSCADLPTKTLGSSFAAIWVLSRDRKHLELRGKSGNHTKFSNISRIVVDEKIIDELIAAEGNFEQAGQLLQKAASGNSGVPKRMARIIAEPLVLEHNLVGIAAMLPTKRFSSKALMSVAITCKTIALAIASRQAEQKLKKSDRLFTEITNNIEEMIWVTQPGGFGVKWVSPALARMFGRTQQEIIKNPLITVEGIHPDDQAAAFAFFQYGSSQPSAIEYRQSNAENEYRWIWSRAYPTFDATHKLAEVYGIATDITQRKDAEKRVNEFYSMVSHELRTPLTSIHASLRIMEGGIAGPLTDKISRLVAIARSETDRLIRLINDILDIRKLEAGMLELQVRQVATEKLVDLAFSAVKGMADSAGISLISQVNWQGSLYADQDRTLQMLVNLLSNAIKFSSPGGNVQLIVDQSNDSIRFSVQDQGPGIPAQQMHKLFNKFQQLDSSDSRMHGGSGLGLAITKAIAEQHGGKVGVESEVGVGSKFWIELPVANRGQIEISRRLLACSGSRHNVLLIENDSDYADELTIKMRETGLDLTTARSFREADELLKTFKPQAILADLDRDEAEGLLWIERREEDSSSPNTIVLANAETCINSGHNTSTIAWHVKPCSLTSLRAALSFAVKEFCPQGASVLVIEPSSVVSELIAHQLETLAIEVVQASNGSSAIAKAKSLRPELIILDTSIIVPNAFELVEQLRTSGLASTPLLVYTAEELTHKEKEDLALGTTKYLTMSEISEQDFLATVRYLLDGRVAVKDSGVKPVLVST